MPAVASTNPPVLIAHLAAVTERIKVGSGGVMLPNHAPLVVAEQFALLEALHPAASTWGSAARRAPTSRPPSRCAATPRRSRPRTSPSTCSTCSGSSVTSGSRAVWRSASRRPRQPARRRRWCCSGPAVSPRSWPGPRAAVRLRPPLRRAAHAGRRPALPRLLRPSAALSRPYTIVTAAVLTAETDDEARRLALPGQLMRLSIRTNRLRPVPSLAEAEVDPERAAAEAMPQRDRRRPRHGRGRDARTRGGHRRRRAHAVGVHAWRRGADPQPGTRRRSLGLPAEGAPPPDLVARAAVLPPEPPCTAPAVAARLG